MELSIVMPCRDEAETLERCVAKARRYLDTANVDGEIIVVDNGSTDGSGALARRLGVRVVDVADPGYGSALLGGILAARGTFVVMGDADDSYDFSALEPFVTALRAGADLVMGDRFAGASTRGPCRPCTATSATRPCPSSAGCSSGRTSGTSTAGCERSAAMPSWPSTSSRRAWSSPARWSSRPR